MATDLLISPRKVYNPPSPRRPKDNRGKAVTIGIGIRCTDGIVLSADTLITVPGSHKYYESKIFAVSYPPLRDRSFFTFAGYPELMKTFRDKFTEAALRSDFDLSVSGVKDTTEDILQEMEGAILNSLDSTGGLQMLCASFIGGNLSLLRTSETSVHKVGLYDYVGAGDSSLLRYLSSLLLTQTVSVKIGSIIASYLVTKAKQLVDGCGGETDLVQIMADGKVHSFTVSFKDREILMAEFYIKQFIGTVFIPSISDDHRNKVFESLSTSFRDLLRS